ncbi:hypothetical protein [Nonomuraea sp. NPDC049141]|uniref:hypothetical protein n=1 Tax=Nonomuraea sp. NPDC049141 TaxID=3155500 RepID=UPI00340D1610
MTSDDDHRDEAGQRPTDAGLNRNSPSFEEATTAIRGMAQPRNAHYRTTHPANDAYTVTEPTPDPDLLGAFRRFYVWRDRLGGWRARPMPKLTTEEIAYGLQQELVADTALELAFACTWQRSRRNVYRYLRKYAVETTHRGSAS